MNELETPSMLPGPHRGEKPSNWANFPGSSSAANGGEQQHKSRPPNRMAGLQWEDGSTIALAPEQTSRDQQADGGIVDTLLSDDVEVDNDNNDDADDDERVFPAPAKTFRRDVKDEWVDAIFGPDCFPRTGYDNGSGVKRVVGSPGEADVAKAESDDSTPAVPYVAARQGVGLSGMESYVAYGAVIPAGAGTTHPFIPGAGSPAKGGGRGGGVPKSPTSPTASAAAASDGDRPRIGVTLSRIPLGLYVRAVDVTGEAYAAGVLPGSVLVDVNGLGVLGEPSHKLLERLWQYEGHFGGLSAVGMGAGITADGGSGDDDSIAGESTEDGGGTGGGPTSAGAGGASAEYGGLSSSGGVQGPVALRFIRDGTMYTAMLLTRAPFGISWAPCGNFALVQRSYSFAEAAGVRRGCIVAAVNGKSLRDMDHVGTAEELKSLFASGEQITMVLAYTPASSRTGIHERGGKPSTDTVGKDSKVTERDGVKVKRKTSSTSDQLSPTGARSAPHPFEGFLTCGAGAQYMPVDNADGPVRPGARGAADPVADLANKVAAGIVVASTGMERTSGGTKLPSNGPGPAGGEGARSSAAPVAKYSDCPTLPKEEVVTRWNALETLVYCVYFHLAGYNEEKFREMGGIFNFPEVAAAGGMHLPKVEGAVSHVALHSPDVAVEMLRRGAAVRSAGDAFNSYLIQLVSLLSSKDSMVLVDQDAEEAAGSAQPLDERLVDMLLNLAVENDELCQRLNFLFRSFLASLEDEKGEDRTTSDGDDTTFSQATALRYAQQRLSSKLCERALPRGESAVSGTSRVPVGTDEIGDILAQTLAIKVNENQQGIVESKSSPKKKKGKVGKKIGRLLRTKSTKKEKELQGIQPLKSSSWRLQNGNAKQEESIQETEVSKSLSSETYDSATGLERPQSMSILFDNMAWFLAQLDTTCKSIERNLLKSISQKITEWALQPWSASKDKALADVTAEMRKELQRINADGGGDGGDGENQKLPLLNPIDASVVLLSVDPERSYILPSAHFPLLLSFNSQSCASQASSTISHTEGDGGSKLPFAIPAKTTQVGGEDKLYRTKVEVVALHGSTSSNGAANAKSNHDSAYIVHAAVAGVIQETGRSTNASSPGLSGHRWNEGNVLSFDKRSSWGHPKTLSVRISSVATDDAGMDKVAHTDENGMHYYSADVGYCWVDLESIWDRIVSSEEGAPKTATVTCHAQVSSFGGGEEFDHQGYPVHATQASSQRLEVEFRITNECIELGGSLPHQCMLLYKHDDDMRQEMLAIEFIEACDRILRASGLDLKLRTFRCLTVGDKQGFIEWVAGTVPLSEISKPVGSSATGGGDISRTNSGTGPSATTSNGDGTVDDDVDTSSLPRVTGNWCKYESLRSLRQGKNASAKGRNIYNKNPVQDFLRACAYDAEAPYFIRKDVMDTYVRSCAGYSVITYLLGVGDRHLDNLLLHPKGYFIHCDYSFILGQDPKTYLPMRITEEMVLGMGGRDSDNFAKFLSLAGAAFVALRRHSNVRLLMSLVRNVAYADLPDVSRNQSPEDSLLAMRYRFRLDLSEDEALSFIERLIESSIASKIWIAVDAIHRLGKHF